MKPSTEEFECKARLAPEAYTVSGIPIKIVYDQNDLKDFTYEQDIGSPGEFPFTRGVYPCMYREQFWTMRQVMGIGTGRDSRERIRYLLEMGQTGIAIVPDVATTWGLDSDNPRSEGEVGRLGVALSSLQDMEDLFKDIPLDKITISLVTSGNACYIMAMYIALAKKKGIPLESLIGSVQNDVLREFYARGMWIILPLEASLKLCVDIIEFCTKNVPRWNVNTIAGYQTRESGANAVQEVAFLLADSMAYIEACINRGMNIDEFALRFSFYMSSHTYLFEEVAKFRAARRMYAKIMKEKYGARDSRSLRFRFHVQTAANTLTAQQPLNNSVRVTLQALAAVLGGAQSLHTNAIDEAYATPREESARNALRVQQIIAYESGAGDTVDPLAGSYFVEALTNKIEEEAWRLIEDIEKQGETMLDAVLNCIKRGYFANQIKEEFYGYQKDIESGKRVVVGVNRFQVEEDLDIPVLEYSQEWAEEQQKSLRRMREERKNDAVEASINRIKAEAQKGVNLIPALIEAAGNYVTMGEVFDALRDVYGSYNPTGAF
ncbi:MAG: methylmalonyl-CoA mutase family protein [Candidatus Micrarchaeota archaeon]